MGRPGGGGWGINSGMEMGMRVWAENVVDGTIL